MLKRQQSLGLGPDTILFDVSDMFGYFPDNRLPTGVQRVQISVILSFLDMERAQPVALVRFVESRDEWVEVPIMQFRRVCCLSLADGDTKASDWRIAFAELETATSYRTAMAFPRGAYLVNLGTSWWLPNYFLYIRKAKAEYGIRYVPLIHDMIPILRPSECHPDLVHDFVDWLLGVLQHADAFLANSNATKADLIAMAARLDVEVPSEIVAVVPLQAELNQVKVSSRGGISDLAKWGLSPGSFVLFVSTLETRKNQLGAFDAWQRLVATHGRERVPQLVCVGKIGFHGGEVIARRDASVDLKDKVLILDRIDDSDLEALYRHCLFTLYPSYYEGWGLPVTESLCYGKVPLTADNSSLPQAGAGFSLLFKSGSSEALLAALERLIYDSAYRKVKEQAIADDFVPRSWTDVAQDIAKSVRSMGQCSINAGWAGDALPIEPGFFSMTRNRETQLSAALGSGEIFRTGAGWWRLEDHGCWTRANGGALHMLLPLGTRRIGLKLFGLPSRSAMFTVQINGQSTIVKGSIPANAAKWVFVDLKTRAAGEVTVVHLASDLTEIVIDHGNGKSRDVGVALSAFFIFDSSNPNARRDFVEAAALGGLDNYKKVVRRPVPF